MPTKTEVITMLCRLLSRGDEADRCHVSRALGRLKAPEALPALTERLYDEDPDVCIDAAEALGSIGDPEAVAPLLELLRHHPEGEVRTAAVEAVAKISDPRVPAVLLEIAAGRPQDLAWDDEWDDWWDMQLHAIDALGRKRVAEAIPVLEHLLEDEENQGIETELLTALARIGGEGLRAIEQRLAHGAPAERRRAATVLGHAASGEAIELLGRALLDQEAEVRSAAIRALGAANACSHLKVILVSLKDPDAGVRSAAVETCRRLAAGARHVGEIADQLAPLLEDENPLVRAATIETMTTLATAHPLSPALMERIQSRLDDPDSTVATAACRFLARHPVPEAKADLLRIASSRDEEGVYLRQQAILALGSISDPDDPLIEALIPHIDDPEQPIRLETLNTLMKLASAEEPTASRALAVVIDTLRRRPETEETTVPGEGGASGVPSSSLSPPATPEEGSAAGPAPCRPTSTLEAIALGSNMAEGAETSSPVAASGIDATEDELSGLREYLDLAEEGAAITRRQRFDIRTDAALLAARVLGSCDRPEGVTALVECLDREEPALRREAALSLGRIASRSPGLPALQAARGPLLAQLEQGDTGVRHACIRTLARLGSPESLPHLLEALQDDSALVRIEALNGLVELSTVLVRAGDRGTFPAMEVLKRLQGSLTDPASGVRLAAAKGLGSLLPELDREGLTREVVRSIISAAFVDHGGQAREMGRLLARIEGDGAVDLLLQRLDVSSTSAERRIVIELLEEILLAEESNLYPDDPTPQGDIAT